MKSSSSHKWLSNSSQLFQEAVVLFMQKELGVDSVLFDKFPPFLYCPWFLFYRIHQVTEMCQECIYVHDARQLNYMNYRKVKSQQWKRYAEATKSHRSTVLCKSIVEIQEGWCVWLNIQIASRQSPIPSMNQSILGRLGHPKMDLLQPTLIRRVRGAWHAQCLAPLLFKIDL